MQLKLFVYINSIYSYFASSKLSYEQSINEIPKKGKCLCTFADINDKEINVSSINTVFLHVFSRLGFVIYV